ncbi:response regulator, partial [Methanobrevibacter sp.]|uniref:response regulator n=1 Tax=Methanobrevibacter sp. TaxID=66852 RepID=UPI0026E07368
MTELQLIRGKPKIFAISSEEIMLSQIKSYVEEYNYEYVGSAFEKEDIFKKIDEYSPNLIFLDTEEENLDLLQVATDLEIFNIPVIVIIGALFDETIDKLLTSNPFGYLLKPLEKDELQRAMAVSLKKHEQNLLSVQTAQHKIQEKNVELLIEKSDSSFLLILCVALIIIAILSRNATWMQWVLLIPTLAMLINALVSIKKQ